jgi:hypothetical protein
MANLLSESNIEGGNMKKLGIFLLGTLFFVFGAPFVPLGTQFVPHTWAQGSKVSDLTEKTTPPAAQSDWVYFIDMSESTAANRSKKISPQNLKRTHSKWVDSWQDMSTISGDSVFVMDLAVADTIYVDTTAIFAGATMDQITGLTVVFPQAVAGVSNIPFTVVKTDGGVTGVILVGYTANGTAYQNMWVNVQTGVTATTNRSGTSDWELDSQGDSKTFVLCPDPESDVSAYPVAKSINTGDLT